MYAAKCDRCHKIQGFQTNRQLCICGGNLFGSWIVGFPRGCKDIPASWQLYCLGNGGDFQFQVYDTHSGHKFGKGETAGNAVNKAIGELALMNSFPQSEGE